MKRQKKKAFVSNPLANATGKQFVDSGKKFTLEKGSLVKIIKPYKPVQCGMYKLPKYYLPDVETAVPFAKGKGKIEDIMNIFKKYPNLDYVSAYHFSTKDNEVNKKVWEKFLDLYDQGYIKRIYDKINGYFASDLQNYVKAHSQKEIDNYFIPTYVEEVISEEITTNNGFKDDAEKQRVLHTLIYDFVNSPERLFSVMYENAKQQLLTEARKLTLKITRISDKEDGAWFQMEDGATIPLGLIVINAVKLGTIFDTSLLFNWRIHKDAEKENTTKVIYSVALKDNLTQLQVSTKGISKAENEDSRSKGDYPTGGGEDAGGSGNNGKNSDKTMLFLGAGILAAIFFLKKKYKR